MKFVVTMNSVILYGIRKEYFWLKKVLPKNRKMNKNQNIEFLNSLHEKFRF